MILKELEIDERHRNKATRMVGEAEGTAMSWEEERDVGKGDGSLEDVMRRIRRLDNRVSNAHANCRDRRRERILHANIKTRQRKEAAQTVRQEQSTVIGVRVGVRVWVWVWEG